jgi:hypothetical protein
VCFYELCIIIIGQSGTSKNGLKDESACIFGKYICL